MSPWRNEGKAGRTAGGIPRGACNPEGSKTVLLGKGKGESCEEDRMVLGERSLTAEIIGAAILVHRTLGPGFLESVYEEALAIELADRQIGFSRQVEAPVLYKGRLVGQHRPDLVVEGRVVVELKAVKSIETVHYAVVRSYLHALGLHHGLILNFSEAPVGIRRVASADALRPRDDGSPVPLS